MSSSAALGAQNPNDETSSASRTRNARNDRAAGKGRRRRAAAEQRRTEQQHWSRLMHENEEEIMFAPRAVSRRQLRRSARNSARNHFEDCHASYDEAYDDDDLDVALAISLSLSENNSGPNGSIQAADLAVSGHGHIDMSYESLVLLENVKCTASSDIVNTLIGKTYMKDDNIVSYETLDELCTVCLVEFKVGDPLMVLPCTHAYHEACGCEWFLNHSKLCPVCKHDVTELH